MTDIDPILDARLDLLKRALDEANMVRQAREDQKERLDAVSQFLRPGGELFRLRSEILTHVTDARTRLAVALDAESAQAEFGEDEAAELTDTTDVDRIKAAYEILNLLKPLISETWETGRREAYAQFHGLNDWSVAGLDDDRLSEAIDTYETALDQIRSSSHPWATYEEQLRNRERELFNAYFRLVGSMAVRGLRVVDDLAADRAKLLTTLLSPLESKQQPAELPSPNLLTRSEHVQLGYLGWNLWAMPLLGREAGLHLIRKKTFKHDLDEAHYVICADAYSAHILGPSYVAAALFLDLDPDGPSLDGAPSDPERAELLLELLPQLAPEPQRPVVEEFTTLLRDAWQQARVAIGAPPVVVSDELRVVTGDFRATVEQKFPDGAYDLGNLANRIEEAGLLANGSKRAGTGVPRDVLVAMWWARVSKLGDCETIDASARESMSPAPSSAASAAPLPGLLRGK